MFNMNPGMGLGSAHLDPRRFYELANLARKTLDDEELMESVEACEGDLFRKFSEIETQRLELAKANNNIFQEIRNTVKKNPFASFEDQEQDIGRFSHTLGGQNFLRISFTCVDMYFKTYQVLLGICRDLRPGDLLISEENLNGIKGTKLNFEKLQQMTFESQLNSGVIQRFIGAILALAQGRGKIVGVGNSIIDILDGYYKSLLNRHTVEGVKIHDDPVITDIAISVFENIDSHGEIESGKKPDELSAYSLHKAEAIINALQHKSIHKFVSSPEALIQYILKGMEQLWKAVDDLSKLFGPLIDEVEKLTGKINPFEHKTTDVEFYSVLQVIKDLNPYSITEKEPTRLLSSEEIYNINFKNETLAEIVAKLRYDHANVPELIQYILERKAHLRSYFQNENSFYVCRIGAGNSFLGEAPGALTVVPGAKPNINLDDIIGSGFNEIRSFVNEIEASGKWHDLFVATSPSKTADKANVLLIGPQGCGKTEALRAVASDRKSIGVFAQGSDFMTCWKGEAEKNPKRLFEAAVKLQREANRHVHILIDEIDSILKKQELTNHGEFNLTLEFQILMDGLVHYRGISVWGTTNNPERLPMPMLRRFSKVLIVGELDEAQRIQLLKYFAGFMPVETVSDEKWKALATKLDGATGDVIRKIVDHVWRTKMTEFVQNNPVDAIALLDSLNNGAKFEIAHFDDKQRFNFKQRLGKFVTITANDIDKSIDIHLTNVAIYNEIQTAKSTYREAKEFLDRVSSNKLAS